MSPKKETKPKKTREPRVADDVDVRPALANIPVETLEAMKTAAVQMREQLDYWKKIAEQASLILGVSPDKLVVTVRALLASPMSSAPTPSTKAADVIPNDDCPDLRIREVVNIYTGDGWRGAFVTYVDASKVHVMLNGEQAELSWKDYGRKWYSVRLDRLKKDGAPKVEAPPADDPVIVAAGAERERENAEKQSKRALKASKASKVKRAVAEAAATVKMSPVEKAAYEANLKGAIDDGAEVVSRPPSQEESDKRDRMRETMDAPVNGAHLSIVRTEPDADVDEEAPPWA